MSTRWKKVVLFSLVLHILNTASQKTAAQGRGATKSATFEKLSSSSGLSLQVVTSYTGVSRLSCASRCLSSVKRRGYFTHNAAQQTCACGVNLLASPLPTGESLYAPKCDQPGYQLYVRGSARVCVKKVNSRVNYETAKDACWSDGEAYLYMPDTEDKRDLLDDIKYSQVWVGMDDIEEEGVLRFNDGRLVPKDIDIAFINDNTDGVDCVLVRMDYFGGSEYSIITDTRMVYYICEIAIE